MRQVKYLFIPLGLSVVAGLMYLFTAAPLMLWVDAPDFIAASVTLGINNPPAPLYVFIAHLFTLLPFSSVVFRLQLFSTLLASVSLFLSYHVIIGVIEQLNTDKKKTYLVEKNIILGGGFGVLTLAFSYEFWSQAQNAERFIFTCFMELIVMYLISVSVAQKRFIPVIFLVAFVSGMAIGIDPVVISFFPSVLLILRQKRRFLTIKKLLLLGATGLAEVLLAYSYLPLMSRRIPSQTSTSALQAVLSP